MTETYPRTRLRFLAEFNPPVPPSVRSVGDIERRVLPMDAIHEFAPPSQGDTRPASSLLSGYSYLEPTDIAYAKVTPCFENGKGIVGSDLDGPTFATTEVTVLRPTQETNQRFLAYLLQSTNFRSPAIASMTGAGGLKRVSESLMKDLMVPSPSSDEQRQIADYLDHETAEIDAFIEDQQAMMRLLQERERSLIWDLVTGKNIDISREKTIEAFWQELPKTWTLEKVGWHFDVGNGSTPSTSTPRYWDQMGFPWVNSSSVNSDLVTEPARRVSQEALNELHLPIVPAGSLLIGITGQGKTRGTVTKLGITTTINQHVAYLTPRTSSRLNVDYARRGLEAAYPQLRHLSDGNGGTKGALTCEMVQQFRLPVPPAEVQIRIVQDLDIHSSETESALLDAQLFIDLALERRAALITAAVTGQIDVTAKNKPAAEQLEDDIAQGLHKES